MKILNADKSHRFVEIGQTGWVGNKLKSFRDEGPYVIFLQVIFLCKAMINENFMFVVLPTKGHLVNISWKTVIYLFPSVVKGSSMIPAPIIWNGYWTTGIARPFLMPEQKKWVSHLPMQHAYTCPSSHGNHYNICSVYKITILTSVEINSCYAMLYFQTYVQYRLLLCINSNPEWLLNKCSKYL